MLVTIASLVWARPAAGRRPSFEEPEVKAVFLFNIAQFVAWPESALSDRQSAFVIGILGTILSVNLDDVVKGEAVGGRALVVERFHRVEDIRPVTFSSSAYSMRSSSFTSSPRCGGGRS